MENSKVKRYSIGIPILFLLLFLSSVVGIIGASFRLDAAITSDGGYDATSDHPTYVIRIIVASILTLIFLLLTIFGFLEVGEPQTYEARVLTDSFERKLVQFANNLESWELILVFSNFIILPIGIAVSLIDANTGYLWMSFASLGIVTWSYNYRVGTRNSIKRMLPKHTEISLTALSQAISRDQNRVKKTILYLISYEDYPAQFDFGTQVITYHGTDANSNPLADDVIVAESTPSQTNKKSTSTTKKSTKKVTKKEVVTLKPCPFCDTMPISNRARFCLDCGASIVPAK